MPVCEDVMINIGAHLHKTNHSNNNEMLQTKQRKKISRKKEKTKQQPHYLQSECNQNEIV